MTKRSSKIVSDDTNNTTPNKDFNYTDNSSSSRISTTVVVSSNTSKDNNNNTRTVDKNTQQQTQVVVSPLLNPDIKIDDDIDFDTSSSISYKRKEAPTKNSNKKKIVKTSINTTITSLNVTLNSDTNNDDETNVQQLKELSNIWQYAIRNDNKSFATCLLCDKQISTSNWSTSSVRRHLIQVHDKTELILSDEERKKKSSNIRQDLKEKLHNLCVEAIIRDSLPFKAFNKPGLSKLLQEAVPDGGEDDEDEDDNDLINEDDEDHNISTYEEDDEDDNSSNVNEQDTLEDNWGDDIEVDVHDPTLAKDQQMTLSLMIKCRQLIYMIRKSSVLTAYTTRQRKLSKIKRDFIRDICNRWNSSFLMIYGLTHLRPVIEKMFNEKYDLNLKHKQIKKLNMLEISSTEWNYLNQLKHVLASFYHATKALCGSNYPSIGSTFFFINKLKLFLMKDKEDNVIVKRLKKLLLTKMVHYFEEDRNQFNLLKFHSYFDPTGFTALSDADKRLVEYEIKQLSKNDDLVINNLSLTASSSSTTITSTPSATSLSTTTSTSISVNTSSISKTSKKPKLTSMEAFLESVGDDPSQIQTTTSPPTIVEEIYDYRLLITKYNSCHKPLTSSCTQFWKTYGANFPRLFKLAKQFLCTPATSVASESAFSTAAFINRKERSRLSLEQLAATVFLKVSF
ncbi:unnamed protein product [Rotaria sp. Silwood2]|nr:unnamed protein product [Rotaria sp. Silwood2]CAF4444832.1 unnamed protein product [Rotaria sp. Silwood2]